jgi:acetyl esterase/lipase
MKKNTAFLTILILTALTLPLQAQDTYTLWERLEKPHHKPSDVKEYQEVNWDVLCTYNVTEPTLTVYKAEGKNTKKAVIILPGGGYNLLAIQHEGHDIAKALAQQGITGAVLKYRLPNPKSSDQPHLVPLSDTRRALQLLRANAEKYGLHKNAVGVMGFSAGSHLATVTSLWKSDDETESPNFSVLIYGATILSESNQQWLETSLYHRKMTKEEIAQNTLLNLVSKDTPPAFLIHAYDDDTCNVDESIRYAEKLRQHNVPAEMHLFQKGGHGFGLGRDEGTKQWLQLFVAWLNAE